MDRPVDRTRKDLDGDITALCGTGQSWSPRLKRDAISDIELGIHRYYVPWQSGRTWIRLSMAPTGSTSAPIATRHPATTSMSSPIARPSS